MKRSQLPAQAAPRRDPRPTTRLLRPHAGRRALLLLAVTGLVATGCDSPGPPPVTPRPAPAHTAAPAPLERLEIEVAGLGARVTAHALRSDGRCLAVARGAKIEVWGIDAARPEIEGTAAAPPATLAFSDDGRELLADGREVLSLEGLPAMEPPPALRAARAKLGERSDTVTLSHLDDRKKKSLEAWAKAQHLTLASSPEGALLAIPQRAQDVRVLAVNRTGEVLGVCGGKRCDVLRLDLDKTFSFTPWTTGAGRSTAALIAGHDVLVAAAPALETGPSPDVVLALSVTPRGQSISYPGRLYDTRTGKVLGEAATDFTTLEATWSSGGRYLHRGDAFSARGVILDTSSGKVALEAPGTTPSFSERAGLVALRTSDAAIVYSLSSGAPRLTVPSAWPGDVVMARAGSDGELLVATATGVDLWDLTGMRRTRLWSGQTDSETPLVLDPERRHAAICGGGKVHVVDLQKKARTLSLDVACTPGMLAFRPDGKTLAVGVPLRPKGPVVSLVSLSDGSATEVRSPGKKPAAAAQRLAWSSDGRYLAIARADWGHVDVLDTGDGSVVRLLSEDETRPLGGEKMDVPALLFEPGGPRLYVQRANPYDSDVGIFDVATRRKVGAFATAGYSVLLPFSRAARGLSSIDGSRLTTIDPLTGAAVSAVDVGAPLPSSHPFLLCDVPGLSDVTEAMKRIASASTPGAPLGIPAVWRGGDIAAWSTGQGLLLRQLASGTELLVQAATVGRTEVFVALTRDGHFDASPESLPFVRAHRGKVALTAGEVAALRVPGLVTALLTEPAR